MSQLTPYMAMVEFNLLFMSCQISLRVAAKVPFTANMAHSLQISVSEKEYSVTFSDKRDGAVKAFVVPKDDITEYLKMSKKDQKMVQRMARTKIQECI